MIFRPLLIAIFLWPVTTFGKTLTVSTADNRLLPFSNNQGWWSEQGHHEIGLDNYFTGYTVGFPKEQDYRGFLLFDLAAVQGSVVAAHLEILLLDSLSPDLTETIGIFHVSTPATELITTSGPSASIFEDLGTGTLFAAHEVAIGLPLETVLTIPLNAAAIAEINLKKGDVFSVGMAIMTLHSPRLLTSEGLFSGSSGFSNSLVMTIVPEPSSLALCVCICLCFVDGCRRAARFAPTRKCDLETSISNAGDF